MWGLLKNTRNCRVFSVVLGVSILTATALTWFCRAIGLGELLHAHVKCAGYGRWLLGLGAHAQSGSAGAARDKIRASCGINETEA